MNLRLDWVGYDAAKYACEKWHYSRRISKAGNNYIGVWEDEKYIGCIIFGIGATNNIGEPYGLKNIQCIELTRIALTNHKTPVTKLVSIALKLLHRKNPGLKIIVSYADSEQDHNGAIYQAGNWIYVGYSVDTNIVVNGIREHRRTLGSRYGTNSIEWLKQHIDPNAKQIKTLPKYKYLYPLTDDMRSKIEPLRQPYPKKIVKDNKCVSDVTGSISSFHEERGGSLPTLTHQEINGVNT